MPLKYHNIVTSLVPISIHIDSIVKTGKLQFFTPINQLLCNFWLELVRCLLINFNSSDFSKLSKEVSHFLIYYFLSIYI